MRALARAYSRTAGSTAGSIIAAIIASQASRKPASTASMAMSDRSVSHQQAAATASKTAMRSRSCARRPVRAGVGGAGFVVITTPGSGIER